MKETVRADWDRVVLVCGKCSKKMDGGFGEKGRRSLAKALRAHLGLKKGRKGRAGVVEVKCLGICPRDAVTVVNGARPGEWSLVRCGADLDQVASSLGLGER
ncbi:(2Fe-2S) ferredoxin domain-containing protein [Sphingomonas aracearum]|uniref:(2Fe-2S) ferredoxin domain-containing protein n=1 Tax=Sphingomonas aracearum TaxID=2283317 RepID=A0A369VVY2_9SPHN|nr:(2Fe-2S) ferredoxin domain-containing protein [Sphingomonas aracearum]RDE05222.1 (2Fe-2S) ferredoxin domain-containing protein [Sphingomonas aracearum]